MRDILRTMLIASLILGSAHVPAQAADTVTIWTNWGWASGTFQKLEQQFEAQHPGVDVEWSFANLNAASGIDRLTVNIAAGTAPDVVGMTPKGLAEFGEMGVLEPLDSLVDREGLREKFHPAVWNRYSYNGQIYGLPALEGGPGRGLVFNRRLFNERGLAAPGPDEVITWHEMGDLANRLTVTDPDGTVKQIGYFPQQAGGTALGTMSSAFNAEWYDPETGRAMLDRPELVEAMETFYSYFYEPWGFDALNAAASGNRWTNSADSIFVRGVTSMIVTGYWTPGELRVYMPDGDWGVTWMPNNQRTRVQAILGWALFLLKDSDQKSNAMELITYLASPEATQILYNDIGWLGGLHTDLPNYIDLRDHDGTRWYVESLSKADVVRSDGPNPWDDEAQQAWSRVFNQVIRGQGAAAPLLAEENRLLNAQIAEAEGR